ncbi:MAG: VCBS repeat-containing protein [Bacteroidota bacterium]
MKKSRCKMLAIFFVIGSIHQSLTLAQGFYLDSTKIDIVGEPILLDLNHDDYPDLLVLNTSRSRYRSSAKLFINQNGVFVEKKKFLQKKRKEKFVFEGSADVNNDSFIDLLFSTTENGKYYLCVFLNDGNAYFAMTQKFELGRSAYHVAFADLNGNGYQDVAISHGRRAFNWISIFVNKNGVFEKQEEVAIPGEVNDLKSIIHQPNKNGQLVIYHKKQPGQEYLSLLGVEKGKLMITHSTGLGKYFIKSSIQVLYSEDKQEPSVILNGLGRERGVIRSSKGKLTILSYAVSNDELMLTRSQEVDSIRFLDYSTGHSPFIHQGEYYLCLHGQMVLHNTLLKESNTGIESVEIDDSSEALCFEPILELDLDSLDDMDFITLTTPPNVFYITRSATGDIDNDGDIDIVVTREEFGACEKEGIYFLKNDGL